MYAFGFLILWNIFETTLHGSTCNIIGMFFSKLRQFHWNIYQQNDGN